ncbi:flagellar basal body L-ring protein FlgH, partial [Escherichia coli]|nr:flagellar basal body L-ring protein FlgH [Escherichia coli]
RAYRVGDVLTVQLSEETSSSKNAGTKFGKSSAINLVAPTIGTKTIDELGVSVDGKRNFDGSASSSQGNKLQGAITVTVHEVLPNGVLRIS